MGLVRHRVALWRGNARWLNCHVLDLSGSRFHWKSLLSLEASVLNLSLMPTRLATDISSLDFFFFCLPVPFLFCRMAGGEENHVVQVGLPSSTFQEMEFQNFPARSIFCSPSSTPLPISFEDFLSLCSPKIGCLSELCFHLHFSLHILRGDLQGTYKLQENHLT